MKNQGQYCYGCGAFLSNERFSRKGHGAHLCKNCKGNGIQIESQSTSNEDRKFHKLSKAIKNCLILYTELANLFLFEYQKSRYIIRDDFDSEIFIYQGNAEFAVSKALQKDKVLIEVLYKKYYDTIDNNLSLEYDEVMHDENIELSKKQRQYLEVIYAIHHLNLGDQLC